MLEKSLIFLYALYTECERNQKCWILHILKTIVYVAYRPLQIPITLFKYCTNFDRVFSCSGHINLVHLKIPQRQVQGKGQAASA